jgi:predicted transcriptional regulator
MRQASFLDYSLRLEGIKDILDVLKDGSLYYTQILKKSRIKHKASFRKYLDYCESKGFILSFLKERQILVGRFRGEHRKMNLRFYEITTKGKSFMEAVK